MSKMSWPLDGSPGNGWKVRGNFGWRVHPIDKTRKHHNGVDLIGQKYVKAIADGTVIKARASKTRKSNGEPGGYGYFIVIRHMIDGVYYTSLYAHLVKNSFQVKQGQKVKAGQVIGTMGTTGHSTGVHLHLEIWKGKDNGWSADGSGFAEPIGFIRAHLDKDSVTSAIAQGTVDPESVEPIKVPASKPKYDDILKRGDKNESVAFMQRYLGIEADGVFGPQTQAAVIAFQKKFEDITAKDGVVGPITWAKIPEKIETVKKERSHKVKRGEYLSKIANMYGTTVNDLVALNKITNASKINVGQIIKLPPEEIVKAAPIDPPKPAPKICECCKRPFDV